MSKFRRLARQTLTVARRDFVATVFTPTFLLFLMAPLIMTGFAAIGGLGAATVADSAGSKLRLVAIVSPADQAELRAADRALRTLFRTDELPPELTFATPARDPVAQATAMFRAKNSAVTATMSGPLARPTVFYNPPSIRHGRYLARLADEVLSARRLGTQAALSRPLIRAVERDTPSLVGRNGSAFFAVFGLFFITLLLAGQAVGTMAEERSNKVIEVLAAAVPLESVFLGKLIGMFGVAVLFLGFWSVIGANIVGFVPPDAARRIADLTPAIGIVPFALLFFGYFTMAYMLLGAVFLSIGAQASTQREIQMLSLPITIFQVAMFGLSAAAVSNPDAWFATLAEVFPFSSPFAMAGKAAASAQLWPHFAALAWQLLWVSLTIWLGASLFRRGVLQSAGPKIRWFGKRRY